MYYDDDWGSMPAKPPHIPRMRPGRNKRTSERNINIPWLTVGNIALMIAILFSWGWFMAWQYNMMIAAKQPSFMVLFVTFFMFASVVLVTFRWKKV